MDFGFQLPSKCPCSFSSDSVEHLFLHCTLARDVWLFVIHFFDLSLEVGLFDIFHQCWDITGRSLAIRQICRLLPLIVLWALWLISTRILLDGGVPALSSVLQNITGMFQAITGLRPVRTSSSDSSLMGCNFLFCRKLQRVVLPICWQLPQHDALKLDVDGSALNVVSKLFSSLVYPLSTARMPLSSILASFAPYRRR
ncbi:RNA-directed DNA polymerase (reversetranscriptase)-related family protein [Striga asiatica]|uniref:RNA-directed DNA polymerase (Reversetranscriptase)-related family protein n=1 Tax=Striga asiatica TaxID=4170 RepID=A0A5A7PAN6_STRAF|nr:RNA-directed DNA polymerase (reversetranscriptase)-related family protein [Striga asiatica]